MLILAVTVVSIGLLLSLGGVFLILQERTAQKRRQALRWMGFGSGISFSGVALVVIALALRDLGAIAIVFAILILAMGVGTSIIAARLANDIKES